jgi:hypothetical protein
MSLLRPNQKQAPILFEVEWRKIRTLLEKLEVWRNKIIHSSNYFSNFLLINVSYFKQGFINGALALNENSNNNSNLFVVDRNELSKCHE